MRKHMIKIKTIWESHIQLSITLRIFDVFPGHFPLHVEVFSPSSCTITLEIRFHIYVSIILPLRGMVSYRQSQNPITRSPRRPRDTWVPTHSPTPIETLIIPLIPRHPRAIPGRVLYMVGMLHHSSQHSHRVIQASSIKNREITSSLKYPLFLTLPSTPTPIFLIYPRETHIITSAI